MIFVSQSMTVSSTSLRRCFPRSGSQKQGNWLAELLRTQGEH